MNRIERIKRLKEARKEAHKRIPGDQGPIGEKGDNGLPGINGVNGLPGPRGEKGEHGLPGLRGPRGFKGIDGSPGVKGEKGITWRAAWKLGETYYPDDAVSNYGSAFICLEKHDAKRINEPTTGSKWQTYWGILAERGETGPGGAPGMQGIQGPPGDASGGGGITTGASEPVSPTNFTYFYSTTTHKLEMYLFDTWIPFIDFKDIMMQDESGNIIVDQSGNPILETNTIDFIRS